MRPGRSGVETGDTVLRGAWPRRAVLAGLGALPLASPAGAQTRARQAVDLAVPFRPVSVRIGAVRQLVYELHLTSFAEQPLELRRVTVVGADGRALADFSDVALAGRLGVAGARNPARPQQLEPGRRVVLYVEAPQPGEPPPAALAHRVELAPSTGEAAFGVLGGRAEVSRSPLAALGPPLRGGPWVAVYDPSLERGHRRVIYAVEGRARIPGRFAIDWMRIGAEGRTAPGAAERPADSYGYGAEVLAVADGRVVAVRDGVAELDRLRDLPRVDIADAAGNFIALDLSGGRYAFYEHLRPGLRVRPGDRVRAGQTIAHLGFTGETTSPHLHFHVADAPEPLAAEGLPYRLEGARVLGAYDSIAAFGRGGPWRPGPPAAVPADLPAPNTVVTFPAAGTA